MFTAIVLAFILACGGTLAGGIAGEADYQHKIETGQIQVHTEQVTETKVVITDNSENK